MCVRGESVCERERVRERERERGTMALACAASLKSLYLAIRYT